MKQQTTPDFQAIKQAKITFYKAAKEIELRKLAEINRDDPHLTQRQEAYKRRIATYNEELSLLIPKNLTNYIT